MRELTDTGVDAVRGIALVAFGYVVISMGDIAVKWALPVVGVAGAMIWRGVFGAGTAMLLAGRHATLRPVRWGLLLFRSFVHTGTSVAWYIAWLSMSMVDTYAVGFTTPLLMTLLAVPILGERIRWRRIASTAVGFLGVLVMLRPGGDLWQPAVVPLLGGVVLLAISRILTRELSKTETPECQTFFLLLAHIPVGLALLVVWPSSLWLGAGIWAAMVALGACNGIAHWLFSRGYGLAPVGALAPYEYTPMLWGGVGAYIVFGEEPSWNTLGGAAIVAAAGLYNLHRERVRRREEMLAVRGVAGRVRA